MSHRKSNFSLYADDYNLTSNNFFVPIKSFSKITFSAAKKIKQISFSVGEFKTGHTPYNTKGSARGYL